jgi:hypothetical protein
VEVIWLYTLINIGLRSLILQKFIHDMNIINIGQVIIFISKEIKINLSEVGDIATK